MNYSKRVLQLMVALTAIVVMVTACKRTFDEPPYSNGTDPDLKVTHTIKQFQALYTGAAKVITDDVIIAGVVIGDDASGNIFKYIVIQDSTAGLNIQLDASSLNATYPVGRKVFIKAKGLTLGVYGGMLELGLGVSSTGYPARIPQSVIADYLVPGTTNNVVVPIELTIAELKNEYQSMLVTLKDVEVASSGLSATYADTTLTNTAVNVSLEDCNGGSLVMRTSSYANFAGTKVPQGKGNMTGIYTFYNTTGQFVVRDLTDVAAMTGTRCNGSTGSITIAALRAAYTGTDVAFTSGSVTGVIVSNANNEAAGNYRLAQEDNGAGVILYFGSAISSLTQGTKVTVNLSGGTITAYNADLELKSLIASNVASTSTGTVTPRVVTVAQILANRAAWSSTLATINNATIAIASSTSSGVTYTISDATGSLSSYVRATAGITLAAGTATSVTGYVSVYKPSTATDTTTQLGLRTQSDIVGFVAGSTGGGSTTGIALTTSGQTIDFNSIASGLPQGVTTKAGASASVLGRDTTYTATATAWNSSTFNFRNVASFNGTGITSASVAADQAAATDRALGLRQTGGVDSGAAFIFEINNTTGKTNLQMSFQLQSLDVTITRLATWRVDYATGDNPTSFTAATTTGTLTTGNSTFASNTVTASFGTALNNISSKIYIRVVALSNTTGSGSRPTTAIDNVSFSWQ